MICRPVERRRELLAPCLLALGFSLALAAAARADEDLGRLKGTGEVVITSGGGTWEDAQRKAYFEPFEKDTGIKVVLVPEDHAKLLASVKSGAPEADLTSISAGELAGFDRQGAIEDIDWSLFDKETVDNMPAPLKNKRGVGAVLYSIAVAFSTKRFPDGGAQPKNWADYYDLAKFPGPRGSANCQKIVDGGMLEGALMGDGVAPDKLYPLDVDRAFKKLEAIKPNVKLWWDSGAAAPQALIDGEADVTSAYNGRIYVAQKKGAPVKMSWDQSLIQYDYWVVMKNAPNKANAMKFLAYISRAKPQAVFAETITYGPTNNKAYDFMKQEIQAILPGSPQNAKVQVFQDYAWWNTVGSDGKSNWDRALERCVNLLSQ
jgi:putative spermidine/putrescine transport system substrate-binding protein